MRAIALIVGLVAMIGDPQHAHAADENWSGTICDPARPHVENGKSIAMILWRGPTNVEKGFQAYLEDNGVDFNVTCFSAQRDRTRIPMLIEQVRELAPDLVYTWGTSITKAVVGEYGEVDPAVNITEFPVIFTMVSYPVESGIVPSFDATGRNITGSSHMVPEDAQIRAMQSYRTVRRIGVIYNPLESNSEINIQRMQKASENLNIEVIALPVPIKEDGTADRNEVPALISQLSAREVQFLYIGPDNFVGENMELIISTALTYGIPTFTGTELEIRDGNAMIGLVTLYPNLGRYMASLAEKILIDGEAPVDIPVRTLDRFAFLLRMEIASELGLYPPLAILDFAEILDEGAL